MNPTPVEQRPQIRFPKENGNIKHLLVVSFSPNKFTSNNEKLSPRVVCFFYGSDQNVFWEFFCKAQELGFFQRCDPAGLQKWLIDNHWGVTDIVLKTKRAKGSAADSDLTVEDYNNVVIKNMLYNNPIEKNYCTSIWVKERFQSQILNNRIPSLEMIQLISTSRNG